MNIVTRTTTTRQPEFVVALLAAEFLSPYMLGVTDAERGELCLPEVYYTRKGEQREYAEGYESVVGRTLLSDQVIGRKRIVTDAEIAAELEEYADSLADVEFWRTGC